MPTRRELIKYALVSAAATLLMYNARGSGSDIDILMKSHNRLFNTDTSIKIKTLLMEDCYSSGDAVKCDVLYGKNKRETDIIKKTFPELVELLQNDDKKYEIISSAENSTAGINIQPNKQVIISLPKESFSQKNINDILVLEHIAKQLSYKNPKNINKDGIEAGINCIVELSKYTKCYLDYENIGKKLKFINEYLPKIDRIKNGCSLKIRTPKKYRSIEARVRNNSLNITLGAEDY